MNRFISCSVASFTVACASALHAGTVEIPAAKDNTMYQNAIGSISNGAGGNLFCGRTSIGNIRRTLIAFDIASNVPAGSIVTSVELFMTVAQAAPGSGPRVSSLHRALADWGEGASNAGKPGGAGAPSQPGDATWIHTFYATAFWGGAGGDYAAGPSASAMLDYTQEYSWGSTPAMVSDVQGWLGNPAANFGWVLIGDESTNTTAKKLRSRESDFPNDAPRLVIEFELTEPIPAVSHWGMLLTSLVLLAAGTIAFRRNGPLAAC